MKSRLTVGTALAVLCLAGVPAASAGEIDAERVAKLYQLGSTPATYSSLPKYSTADLAAGIEIGENWKFILLGRDRFCLHDCATKKEVVVYDDPHLGSSRAFNRSTEYGNFRDSREVIYLSDTLAVFVRAVDGSSANWHGLAEDVYVVHKDKVIHITNIHYNGGNAMGSTSYLLDHLSAFDPWKGAADRKERLYWNGSHVVDYYGKAPNRDTTVGYAAPVAPSSFQGNSPDELLAREDASKAERLKVAVEDVRWVRDRRKAVGDLNSSNPTVVAAARQVISQLDERRETRLAQLRRSKSQYMVAAGE